VEATARLEAIGAVEDSVYFTLDTLAYDSFGYLEGWDGINFSPDADTCRFEWCVLEHSRCAGYGGLLWMVSAPLTMRNSTCRDNRASVGGVACLQGYVDISHCLFESNSALQGGVFFSDFGTGTITDCVFRNNFVPNPDSPYSGGEGGVLLYASHSPLRFQRCDFLNNAALGGGAVWVPVGDTSLVFEDCRFVGNHADSCGGAMGSQTSSPASAKFVRCLFDSNSTPGAGGGLLICSSTVIDHCVITHNSASLGGGICLRLNGCPWRPSMRQNTIIGNTAAEGAGIHLQDWAGVRNNIIAFNHGPGMHLPDADSSTIGFNLLYGNSGGNVTPLGSRVGQSAGVNRNGDLCDAYMNVLLDPLLVDTATEDYHLTETSPCIDAGDPASPNDPDSTLADIGAHYFPHPNRVALAFVSYPSSLILSSYPNPFNPSTEISFTMSKTGQATLAVYDLQGRIVKTLLAKVCAAGEHRFTFEGAALPSGVYFARLSANHLVRTHKLLLLK
jgi:hypothetical protein